MSRFIILRVDHYDPVTIGKRNRRLYTVYGVIPGLFIVAINLLELKSIGFGLKYLISALIAIPAAVLIILKVRANNKNLKPIGEIEITQSGIKKLIGDVITEYNYQSVKELTLTKHMPATRMKESKSGYYSYILKIEMIDGEEESLVIADRSVDHDHKISMADTIKTLKKLVPFEVKIDI